LYENPIFSMLIIIFKPKKASFSKS